MNIKESVYKHLPLLPLNDFFGYMNEIHGGYINANYHPENSNIIILNYTEETTYERRWNKYTMSARGLILDLTDIKNNGKIYILAKPFDKFFNYGESEEYEKDIDFSEVESVMEKMDGSLGISYFFNGEIRFATRGSFTSEQAIKATEMWKRKYPNAEKRLWGLSQFEFAPTLLVEIIYPENRIVVDYKGEESLTLLGVMVGRHDASPKLVDVVAENIGLPVAPQHNLTLEQMLKMKESIPANEEGWIIRFNNGKRLKIKGDEYLDVHRVLYGLSDKAKVKAWSEGDIDRLILMMPEEFRDEIERLRDDLDEQAIMIHLVLHAIFDTIYENYKNRKDFALMVNEAVSKEYRKFMFVAYDNDGKIPRELIKDYIFRNYEHYLEVIRWSNNVF